VDEKILEEIKKVEPMVYLLIKMGEEKKGREALFKKARAGDKKARKILEKAYRFKFIDPKEYFQEKEAEKKGFPIHFFRNLPSHLKGKFLRFEWKEIKEDFENLEENASPSLRKMEIFLKYGRDGVNILMDYFLEEKMEERILKMLKKVRKIDERIEKKLKKFLSELSLEEQRAIFKKVFFNLSFFSRESLSLLKKEILEMKEEELRNLIWQKYFSRLIIKGKFRKRKAKFPRIRVQVKETPDCYFYRAFLGQANREKVEILLSKGNSSKKALTEILIQPFKFLPTYGWIFKTEKEEYLCIKEQGTMMRLMRFDERTRLVNCLKRKIFPKKADFFEK